MAVEAEVATTCRSLAASGEVRCHCSKTPVRQGFLADVVHTVNQSGTRVVLEPQGGATTYEGVVEGTNGFLVSQEVARQEIANGVVCDLSAAIRYSDIKNNQATVESAARLRCLGHGQSYECHFRHVGMMERQ